MNNYNNIPSIISAIPLNGIQKVIAALEGDWNRTMVTLWDSKKKLIDFSPVKLVHPTLKPSVELYFEHSWVGIHCFKRIKRKNVFDEKFAKSLLEYIESNCEISNYNS